MHILLINGVNMDMLAYREKDIYGDFSYEDLTQMIANYAAANYEGITIDFYQSNYEGKIVEKIHEAIKTDKYDAIIMNPAAFSHYSYAIHDALLMFRKPKVEVHLSDVANREAFRQNLVTGHAADTIISGKKEGSYFAAIDYVMNL